MKLIEPNYENCNLNVSATLAEFLHAKNENATLPVLKKTLEKGFRNVIFICFDGMGIYPLTQNLAPSDFLLAHNVQTLCSTFPSTTATATTSLVTNTLPLEHGWFGWSVYFENMGRNVNVFLDQDSQTGEFITVENSPLAHFPYFFDMAETDYSIHTVLPTFMHPEHVERNLYFSTQRQFFANVKKVCKMPGKNFAYCYNPEPDHLMHEVGVTCKKTKSLLKKISKRLERLCKSCPETLFVVTADHGQTDVGGYIPMYDDDKMLSMLKTYPYMEPRAIAFAVKDGLKEEFAQHFRETYGQDYLLFESDELVKRGYFGNRGDKAHLLGDFVAIDTTSKIALFNKPAKNDWLFKGHHTGLTEEMLVPLILIEGGK